MHQRQAIVACGPLEGQPAVALTLTGTTREDLKDKGSVLFQTVFVVFVQEQQQAHLVHLVRLRERERLANKTSQALPQDVVKPFDVAGLTVALACGPMTLLRQHEGIGRPKIRVQDAFAVRLWDARPEQGTSGFASVSNGVSNDLAGSTLTQLDTLGQPGTRQSRRGASGSCGCFSCSRGRSIFACRWALCRHAAG